MDVSSLFLRIPAVFVLILGWVILVSAMWIRVSAGLDVPLINSLFILLGLGAYILPPKYVGVDSGETLWRKLLWLLFAAGVLILGGELARIYILDGRG